MGLLRRRETSPREVPGAVGVYIGRAGNRLLTMLIAQITDLHITDESDPARALVDASARLAEMVDALARLEPRPDVVLLTGDLTDDGLASQYAMLRTLLEPLPMPMLPIPGNHDLHDAFREAFADVLPDNVAADHCSYVVEPERVGLPRLVGFDSSHPDRIDGVAPVERRDWLDSVLDAAPDTPTLLFLHHPPFDSTIWWMDVVGMAPDDATELRRVVEKHTQVELVVCGHIHRPIAASIGSARVSVCPSTIHQVGLEVSEEVSPSVSAPPGAFQLHLWTGDGFVTHTERVDATRGHVQLDTLADNVQRWRAIREATGALRKSDVDH